jgi:hypothetical protein
MRHRPAFDAAGLRDASGKRSSSDLGRAGDTHATDMIETVHRSRDVLSRSESVGRHDILTDWSAEATNSRTMRCPVGR